MKFFKVLDVSVSILLILLFSINYVNNALYKPSKIESNLAVGLFLIGVWHILSMLLHIIRKWKTHHLELRKIYYCCTVLALLGYNLPFFFKHNLSSFSLSPILFVTMAVFYTSLCGHEIYIINKSTKNEKI